MENLQWQCVPFSSLQVLLKTGYNLILVKTSLNTSLYYNLFGFFSFFLREKAKLFYYQEKHMTPFKQNFTITLFPLQNF